MNASDRRLRTVVQAFNRWRAGGAPSTLEQLASTFSRRCQAAERFDALALRRGEITDLQRLERRTGRVLLRLQIAEFVARAGDGWDRSRFLDILDSYVAHVEHWSGDLLTLRNSV